MPASVTPNSTDRRDVRAEVDTQKREKKRDNARLLYFFFSLFLPSPAFRSQKRLVPLLLLPVPANASKRGSLGVADGDAEWVGQAGRRAYLSA